MRYLEPDELLRLVADALRERVATDCGAEARGQVWAAIGILENLAARVIEREGVEGVGDVRDLVRDLDTPEGWRRAAVAARAVEELELERRRPTYFGEIFRRA